MLQLFTDSEGKMADGNSNGNSNGSVFKDESKGQVVEDQVHSPSLINHRSANPSNTEEILYSYVMDDFVHYDTEEPNLKDFHNELLDFKEGTGMQQTKNDLEIQQEKFEKISRLIEQNRAKWKKLEENMMPVDSNEEADIRVIRWRLNELRSMCTSHIRPEYILDSLDSIKRDYVISLILVSKQKFEEHKRTKWKPLDFFRYAARMSILFARLGNTHIKYRWWDIENLSSSPKTSRLSEKAQIKNSINQSLRMSLITNPRFRSPQQIQQIFCFNQSVEAFSDLFPSEVKSELAKYIGYGIYENDRVLQYQGVVPQNLYYILSGKIELVYIYKLMQGEVYKSMGFFTNSQLNNLDDFEKEVPSATYMVAKGQLEVLTLHREDYFHLSNKTNFLAIEAFLHQINIFKEIVISESHMKSGMVQISYYRNDKVITPDSLNDPYFYLIKSGRAAVVRQQGLYDYPNQNLLNNTSNNLSLQKIGRQRSRLNDDDASVDQLPKETNNINYSPKTPVKKAATETSSGLYLINEADEVEDLNFTEILRRSKTMINDKRPRYAMPDPKKPLTRPATQGKKKVKKERTSYVKLDSLKALDIFSLESLEKMENSTQSSLVLISEGAEVIKINKRFFLDNVSNNTLLEIRKLAKSYVSEEDAKLFIDNEYRWEAYKKILMKKTISMNC